MKKNQFKNLTITNTFGSANRFKSLRFGALSKLRSVKKITTEFVQKAGNSPVKSKHTGFQLPNFVALTSKSAYMPGNEIKSEKFDYKRSLQPYDYTPSPKTRLFSPIIGLFFIMLFFSSFTVFSQMKISEIKKEGFISDFNLIVDIIKKQHPNPYKFINKDVFNRKVDSLRKLIVSDPNIYNFVANSPISLIKDVHTSAFLSDDLAAELYKSVTYFPYPVFIEKGRMFVNIANTEIPFGSEIKSINNIGVETILSINEPRVDGNIRTARDKDPDNFLQNFSLLNRNCKQYVISFISPGKKEAQKVVVKPISPSDHYYRRSKCIFPFNLLQRSARIFSDMDDQKQLGVLTVSSFDLSESDAYKEFSNFFKEVNQKKYSKVIIDVRRNSGGNPAIAALLYSFIAKSAFANTYTYKTKNISVEYPQYVVDGNNRIVSEDDIRGRKDYLYQRFDKDEATGWYIGNARLMEGLLTNFPKDKDAFSGYITVLIGAETISAATYFASLVKINKRGVIVGKETASGLDATTAAWFVNFQLPATKTILQLPFTEIYFFNATEDRGRGLMPDKELPTGLFMEYILEYKDPEMSYAIETM